MIGRTVVMVARIEAARASVFTSVSHTCNLPFVTGTGSGNSMTASTTLQTGPSAQTDPPQLFGRAILDLK